MPQFTVMPLVAVANLFLVKEVFASGEEYIYRRAFRSLDRAEQVRMSFERRATAGEQHNPARWYTLRVAMRRMSKVVAPDTQPKAMAA